MYNRWWILLLLTGCFSLSEGYHLQRYKRQNSNCSLTEYKCASGECINAEYICDGSDDCVDGLDEANCTDISCAKFQFKCSYGACINEKYVCDGTMDCKDNSDETNATCTADRKPPAVSTCFTRSHLTLFPRPGSHSHYKCDNGECVNSTLFCNGNANCEDASDETEKNCADYKCPSDDLFRCDYGGCINPNFVCDNLKDCNDGSDEKNCSLDYDSILLPPKSGDCILPEHPRNGKWSIYQSDGQIKDTGEWVQTGTVLEYQCNDKFELSPSTSVVICTKYWSSRPTCIPIYPSICTLPDQPPNGQLVDSQGNLIQPDTTIEKGTSLQVKCKPGYALDPNDKREATCDGSWSKLPTCLKTCASAVPKPGSNMDVRCSLNGYKVHCDKPVDGTQATYKCNSLYEERTLDENPNRFCKDGTWDFIQPTCVPICGLKSNQIATLIAGGKPSQKGDYPWMVGLYRINDTEQFCGGTMITPKITLSAAHCFSEQGSAVASFYTVAAGKYFREFRNINDKDAQYSDLEKLKIHPNYNNGNNFQAFDIAILVLKTPFEITKYVLPVCIEYNGNYDERNLIEATGIVPGWGYTTAVDTPSNVLKELSLGYKSFAQCKLPPDFLPYYQNARDKICAISAVSGQSLCRGDSGGGLVFRQRRDRYYIRGIVSIGLQDKYNYGCDLNEHVLFTSVAYHADFIQRNL